MPDKKKTINWRENISFQTFLLNHFDPEMETEH